VSCTLEKLGAFGEHKGGKGEEVKASHSFGKALIVLGESAEASRPGKGALDDPALGQEDKAALGLLQLDHDQLDAVCIARLSSSTTARSP